MGESKREMEEGKRERWHTSEREKRRGGDEGELTEGKVS